MTAGEATLLRSSYRVRLVRHVNGMSVFLFSRRD